jgi:RNA polymerase sigma-70 factor (ECF subfamily)
LRRNGQGKGSSLRRAPSPAVEDDSIVAADVAGGCSDAFQSLFKKYEGLVFRIARRLLRDEGEAEDVSQQVHMEAYRDIRQFDSRKGSFKAWLLRRALHRSINRRKHLQNEVCYRGAVDIEGDWSDRAVGGNKAPFQLLAFELSHLTNELLATLSPVDRQVIMATFFQCLTKEQAATQLGMTVSAVRHSQQRALSIMHSALMTSAGRRNGAPKESNVG